MYKKKSFAIASIFAIIVIMLFVYPSTDNLINAGQSKTKQDVTALTNVHQISVTSNAVIAHYFGKDVVEKIMKQPGCVEVRMYYGKRANGKSGIVIVGYDKKGTEIVPGVLAGPSTYCPPWCND
jgi:hypothetical protein